MTDNRKNNRGQPKKEPAERKVPLTFHVKAKNHAAIKHIAGPVIKKLDDNNMNAFPDFNPPTS